MRIRDSSSDVCSSDLRGELSVRITVRDVVALVARGGGLGAEFGSIEANSPVAIQDGRCIETLRWNDVGEGRGMKLNDGEDEGYELCCWECSTQRCSSRQSGSGRSPHIRHTYSWS